MKTFVLLSFAILAGITSFAQQSIPPGDKPGILFTLDKESLLEHQKNKSLTLPVNSTIPKIKPGKSQPGVFNQTWADRFQAVLDSACLASNAKGLSAAVLVPGEGLWTGASGFSGAGIPVTTEMRFGIASNTKLFMAVTLVKLQEQGILSLDDPLYQWLPSFPHVDSTATIRQLLTHQSGIFDFWNDNISAFWAMILADTSHLFTPLEVLATIGNPHFVPGHGYSYSNTNYLLAGMIINNATGGSYVQSLHNIIFDPLNMDSTFVGAAESKNGPVVHEWAWSYGEIPNSPMTSAYSAMNTAANINSTPQEMVHWYKALFSGEIISDSSVKMLVDADPTTLYGLGVANHEYEGHHFYEHDGASIGDLSEMIYDVQTGAVFCVMTNSRNMSSFGGQIILPLMNVLWNEYPRKTDDAGIIKIIKPDGNSCWSAPSPSVVLKNFGTQPLTSVDIFFYVDGGNASNFYWTGTLNPNDTVTVNLPAISSASGLHIFTCFTASPNDSQDGYKWNDTLQSHFILNSSAMGLPYNESFDGPDFPPAGCWVNSSSVYNWGRTILAQYNGSGSLVRNNYYDATIGNTYDFDLPLLFLPLAAPPSVLSFEYSYAKYGSSNDTLEILISSDCGASWQTLFYKGGNQLATSLPTPNAYYPHFPSQWKFETIGLSNFNDNQILLRFRCINGSGNNLYLDDIKVDYSTGINNISSDNSFEVYPVPSSSKINITGLPLNTEIWLTDMSGKLIWNGKSIESTTILDMQEFPQGIYILRTTLGVRKIVKM